MPIAAMIAVSVKAICRRRRGMSPRSKYFFNKNLMTAANAAANISSAAMDEGGRVISCPCTIQANSCLTCEEMCSLIKAMMTINKRSLYFSLNKNLRMNTHSAALMI